jgi:hypothetical protein
MIYVAANPLQDTLDIYLTREMCTGKKIRSMSLGQDHELWDGRVFEVNVSCDLEPIMIGFHVKKNILN